MSREEGWQTLAAAAAQASSWRWCLINWLRRVGSVRFRSRIVISREGSLFPHLGWSLLLQGRGCPGRELVVWCRSALIEQLQQSSLNLTVGGKLPPHQSAHEHNSYALTPAPQRTQRCTCVFPFCWCRLVLSCLEQFLVVGGRSLWGLHLVRLFCTFAPSFDTLLFLPSRPRVAGAGGAPRCILVRPAARPHFYPPSRCAWLLGAFAALFILFIEPFGNFQLADVADRRVLHWSKGVQVVWMAKSAAQNV